MSVSGIEETIRYIGNQEVHHQKHSFRDEYPNFLDKHEIEYDEKICVGLISKSRRDDT